MRGGERRVSVVERNKQDAIEYAKQVRRPVQGGTRHLAPRPRYSHGASCRSPRIRLPEDVSALTPARP